VNHDYVMFWWMRGEFAEQREEWQAQPSLDQPGADLLQDAASVASMQQAPLGEPKSDFDVRCVYDSRIVNGYDFNYSAAIHGSSSVGWSATFNVPNGYRIIPRKWNVIFDIVIPGAAANSIASLQQQDSAVPNNQNIIIGMGTGDNPIESFFLCEENTTFGISGFNSNASTGYTGAVTVYGNLIPVTDAALPLSVSNQRQIGTGQIGVN
jgi:hypothetical protein